jgi:hypothetical protein
MKFGSESDEWLEDIIYASDDEFLIHGRIGFPNDPIQKSFLANLKMSGQITDSCTVDKIETIFYCPSGYFITCRKTNADHFKLTKTNINNLFDR